jgi:hypothetical protein
LNDFFRINAHERVIKLEGNNIFIVFATDQTVMSNFLFNLIVFILYFCLERYLMDLVSFGGTQEGTINPKANMLVE